MQSLKLVLPIQTRSDDKSNNHIGYGNSAVRREYLEGEKLHKNGQVMDD